MASKANERDVNIKLGPNATIGLRGTDLWGRGRDDKDIVCLIEGKIDVTGNNGKTLRLDQPRQMFTSARNMPPEPVTTIDAQQLNTWSIETEIEYGKGSKVSGEWKVIIEGFPSRDEARAATRKLRETGYPAENTANNYRDHRQIRYRTCGTPAGHTTPGRFRLQGNTHLALRVEQG